MGSKRRGDDPEPQRQPAAQPRRRTYALRVAPSALKELQSLPAARRSQVAARMQALTTEPRPRGCEPIKGAKGLYRIRVGEYRVVYEILVDELVILIIRVGPRGDVYRGL